MGDDRWRNASGSDEEKTVSNRRSENTAAGHRAGHAALSTPAAFRYHLDRMIKKERCALSGFTPDFDAVP